MPIGNVIQRGTQLLVYNEKNVQVAIIFLSPGDKLSGYTGAVVNVQRGRMTLSYNERGSQTGINFG